MDGASPSESATHARPCTRAWPPHNNGGRGGDQVWLLGASHRTRFGARPSGRLGGKPTNAMALPEGGDSDPERERERKRALPAATACGEERRRGGGQPFGAAHRRRSQGAAPRPLHRHLHEPELRPRRGRRRAVAREADRAKAALAAHRSRANRTLARFRRGRWPMSGPGTRRPRH